MSKKVLIVGGVAGGASAAARLRRMDEEAEIIIFERGQYISFANCGLPYYIGDTITEREMLLVQTPEKMKAMFNIQVRVENEITKINTKDKSVVVKDLKNDRIYEESYDVLVLSPGAEPIKPSIKGINNPNIFTLRNMYDVDAIKDYINNVSPKRAVVIGGGYIGLEMAENLHNLGLKVSVIEKSNQVLNTLDYDMAALVHEHLLSKQVHLYLGDGVKEFNHNQKETEIYLESGRSVKADVIIMAIGVKPDVGFVSDSGIELGQRGGIKVDSYLKTSDPNIYAVGDAIEVEDFILKGNTIIPLAGPANKQGRIVANNIVGKKEQYKGTQGTAIAKIFDLTIAGTGNNEKNLKNEGIEYLSTITQSKSHAGYYPGALPMTIKLIYSQDGTIFGAQIVGFEGVDKRIDVIATTSKFNKRVFDLSELELAYAPPYSSAKDPVNMAGFVASNVLEGNMDVSYWHEIDNIDKNKTIVLDVREPFERDLGFIKDSINIPVGEIRERYNELPHDKEIIVNCQIGLRAYVASKILKQKGFKNVKVLTGGFKHYNTILQSKYNLDNQDYQYGESEMKYTDLNKQEIYNTETGEVNPQHKKVGEVIHINACGLSCPGPIVKVYQKMNEVTEGTVLEVLATDPGFSNDIKSWCEKTGNTLLEVKQEDKNIKAVIKKGSSDKKVNEEKDKTLLSNDLPQNKTIVVFSGELDKAIASFIIANGAAAMGRKVTLFFTFWGLNILRKSTAQKVQKDYIEKMFGKMMPQGSENLGLSKMNMLGMGSKMIRGIMKKKNVASLEELIKQAQRNGVKLMACNMSMDLMGIKREELIDGVDIGGVAAYLGEAEESNVNLFI
ncbi:CoA-disulfide reductase [Herbivorax sp. ANBcel31]|uniref:CoA-disulfide reductase n=1 Tax=Herbivorax sp. ANBcel31 TaxID=3069754 RepID=UPI0027B45979|nr:CoA-disulfide reductase [Herbivorax sp. ANBcel31]MDQ2085550.1 CoA-disulfide reductase [Herbivorax sp. ANBcel31]